MPAQAPTYQFESCPLCAKHEAGKCDYCHKDIPQYAVPSGTSSPVIINTGFDSAGPWHYHLKPLSGIMGQTVVKGILDRGCYLKDYNEHFPDRKMTLAELPKEILFT